MKKQGMAATYTVVTLEEIEKFLKRCYWAMKPQQSVFRSRDGEEVVYDLKLSNKAVVRIFTTVSPHGGVGRDVGQDAIRVGLYKASGGPLQGGKLPIVKRTQGWKDNLRERVDETIEKYEAAEELIEGGKYVDWSKIEV